MSTRRTIIERDYVATLQEVWELWTTAAGIESWWGPEGFAVTVQSMDLRPGGTLVYTMTAVGADQVAFMKQAGMPLATTTSIQYDEVVPPTRLRYTNKVDFVPGVTAYDVATLVELSQAADRVHLRLTLDPMHDDTWTQRAAMGWNEELGKLARRLARV